MRTIWQSLAWKEWQEHKWRLAALTFIQSVVGLVTVLGSDVSSLDLGRAVIVMGLIAGGPLAIFIAAGDAAGERSRGTMPFLQSLPVPLWRVAIFKLVWGLVTVILPAFCMAAAIYLYFWLRSQIGLTPSQVSWFIPSQRGGWTTGSHLVDIAVLIATVSASFYLWTLAAGARRNDEVSAGAFGLMVIVGWWCMLIGVCLGIAACVGDTATQYRALGVRLITIVTATAPAGFLIAVERNELWLLILVIVISLLTHALVGLVYLFRSNSGPELGGRSPQVAVRVRDRRDWLRPVFGSPWQAIAWKQARESGPLAIVGATGVLVVFLIILTTWWLEHDSWVRLRTDDIARLYGSITTALGIFIALVAGIGVALNDMGSKLSGFWRSRPVQPNLWFWIKYMTGLLVVFAALYLPLVVVVMILREKAFHPAGPPNLWNSDLWIIPALQFALFSTALALTCLIRQGVYAAVLSIGAVYISLVPIELIRWNVSALAELPPGVMIVDFVAVGIIATIIGWLAMRNDWGRRML